MDTITSNQPPFVRAKSWGPVGATQTTGPGDLSKVKRQRSNASQQPIEAVTLPDALLKMRTVCSAVGLSSPTIYRKVATGDFPEPVRLGARCTRWKSGDVQAWLAAQTTAARA